MMRMKKNDPNYIQNLDIEVNSVLCQRDALSFERHRRRGV